MCSFPLTLILATWLPFLQFVLGQQVNGIRVPLNWPGLSTACRAAMNTSVACPSFLLQTSIEYLYSILSCCGTRLKSKIVILVSIKIKHLSFALQLACQILHQCEPTFNSIALPMTLSNMMESCILVCPVMPFQYATMHPNIVKPH
jgi:hypothetical protein